MFILLLIFDVTTQLGTPTVMVVNITNDHEKCLLSFNVHVVVSGDLQKEHKYMVE